jgi:uncharacterized membrane protein YgcG
VTTTYSEASTAERTPGRCWTIRLTGHTDRTATVTCSTAGCKMPPRSRNLSALRTFAAQHAAAHARTATVRPNAACHCWAQQCSAHPVAKATQCAGAVVLVLRHDPSVGQVWTLAEVCEACAPLMTHTTVLVRAPRTRPAPAPAASKPSVAPPSSVPGGFSSQGAGGGTDSGGEGARRRPRRGGSRSRGQGGRNPRQAR